jgi:hypothetical protein
LRNNTPMFMQKGQARQVPAPFYYYLFIPTKR